MTAVAKTASVLLPLKTVDALRELAIATERQPDALADEAIQIYLAVQSWQRDHIMQGLHDADAGDFATSEEVAAAFASGT